MFIVDDVIQIPDWSAGHAGAYQVREGLVLGEFSRVAFNNAINIIHVRDAGAKRGIPRVSHQFRPPVSVFTPKSPATAVAKAPWEDLAHCGAAFDFLKSWSPAAYSATNSGSVAYDAYLWILSRVPYAALN